MRRTLSILVCTAALVCSSMLTSSLTSQEPDQRVRKAAKPIPSQYIVLIQPDADPEGLGGEAAARFNGRLRHVYRAAVRGFAIRLPAPAAEALARDPRVRLVEEDAQVQLAQVQASPTWGLDRIDQRLLPLDRTYVYGSSPAQQVTVHVLDTGVRTTHHEFTGRAFIGGDYIDDDADDDLYDVGNDDADPTRPDGQDCHGHGTHVAGTIGGINVGVAKNVIIQSHRVLGCDGSGPLSGIVAAIDAISESTVRPAVASMSLGAEASEAFDEAVRASIASGVAYVVAAGNANVDAGDTSPARVTEAMTIGATTSSDARASFSNFGPSLDLFAPGVSIVSSVHTSDTATGSSSGTSMATPHVSGVAALYLERNPTSTPQQVRDALVRAATPGVVTSAGTGSPNLLLYSGFLHATTATVSLSQPNGGEKLFTGTPYTMRWDVTGGENITRFDLHASADNGVTYTAISGCANLPATARACTWTTPGPATSKGRVRVVAIDGAGQVTSAQSAAAFSIVTGVGTITVKSPNSAVNWGQQSMQQIKWTHNLGVNSYVRIELSRDGGVTFPETIAAAVKNTASSSGYYNWRVSAPNAAAQAVVRISWTSGPTADVSNVAFTIANPFITVSAPSSSSTNWGYETEQRVTWKTNLGLLDQVSVTFSHDGTTFGTSLRTGVAATAKTAATVAPILAAPTAIARVRVTWTNAPSGASAFGTNPVAFKVQPAFVTVTAPNGGETWTAGTASTLRWTSNLGKYEYVAIQLSKDGGLTYSTLIPSTRADGSESLTLSSSWITPTARFRVVWTQKTTVADASNGNFTVQ